MDVQDRLLEQLVVRPGEAAGLFTAGPGVDGRPGLRGLHAGRARGAREAPPRARHRRALRRAGAPLGERPLRAARGPPGDGRGRQGLGDRARHVRRQSAGRPGGLVQETLAGGARPRLPLADVESVARARAASASSTGRTTRRSSRSGSIRSGWNRSGSRPVRATRASGTSATRTSTPSSATSTGTGPRSSSSFSTSRRRFRRNDSSRAWTRPGRSGSSMLRTSTSGRGGTTT